MSEQSEALRLADALDVGEISYTGMCKAAAELRRLHAVNQELLEALKYHQEQTRPIERTRAAIAQAEEQPMNTEALARQHGKPVQEQNAEVEYLFTLEGVEALLAAEREACAKVCENDFLLHYDPVQTQTNFAAAIRARGQA
jgi:hypothetical protein